MPQISALINPTNAKFVNFNNILRWAQSVYQVLNKGVTFALGKTSDSNGVYNTFDITNGNGIMVRIGAAGGTEPISWNSGTHQAAVNVSSLGRKPTGWILCDIDKAANIFRVGAPSTTALTLQTSDTTASITVWIF